MSFPGMADLQSIYIPRPAFVRELNLGDAWRARWIDEHELPENAPVNYAYAVLYMGDKGYVSREAGAEKWGMVEGSIEGETADAWLKREVPARTGATIGKVVLLGFFECRATSHNADFEAGAITVRPFYLVSAKKVADLPEGSGYERRRLPLNEHLKALRQRYPELYDYVGQAADRYIEGRAKGEL